MKEQPNHRLYITILRRMGPERRFKKALELSRALLRRGLKITPEARHQRTPLYIGSSALVRRAELPLTSGAEG